MNEYIDYDLILITPPSSSCYLSLSSFLLASFQRYYLTLDLGFVLCHGTLVAKTARLKQIFLSKFKEGVQQFPQSKALKFILVIFVFDLVVMSGFLITWGPVNAKGKDTNAGITIPQCSHKWRMGLWMILYKVSAGQIVSLYSLPVPYNRPLEY